MITVDAIKKETALDKIPLKWVGMGAISLPFKVVIKEDREPIALVASVNVFVNLIAPSRGIHMSRMYKLLHDFSLEENLNFSSLKREALEILKSQGALSDSIRLELSLNWPVMVKTLKSEMNYQKLYPIKLRYTTNPEEEFLEVDLKLDYSSTCPQSAALSHEVLIKDLKNKSWTSSQEVIQYLEEQGLIATPHAQRSELELALRLDTKKKQTGEGLGLINEIIVDLEKALGTPTQGVVKRGDEQEFAVLNAKHLMFCEDAARKLKITLDQRSEILGYQGTVTHIESLHSHNAIAIFEKGFHRP